MSDIKITSDSFFTILQNHTEVGSISAISAPPGTGKTAFLVQLAIIDMCKGKKILHVSFGSTVPKICCMYEDFFFQMASNTAKLHSFWADTLSNRFIMIIHEKKNLVQQLSDKIHILSGQGLFHPQVVLIDDFPDDRLSLDEIMALKTMTANIQAKGWLTVNGSSNWIKKDTFDQIVTLIPNHDGGTLVRSTVGNQNILIGQLNKDKLIQQH